MLPDTLRLTRYFRRRSTTALMLRDWWLRKKLQRHERRYARDDWASEVRQIHNQTFAYKMGIEELEANGLMLTEEQVRTNQRG